MFVNAVVLWVAGLLTAVPYATCYLVYYAERNRYAPLIKGQPMGILRGKDAHDGPRQARG
jgi:hypothetical protein